VETVCSEQFAVGSLQRAVKSGKWKVETKDKDKTDG